MLRLFMRASASRSISFLPRVLNIPVMPHMVDSRLRDRVTGSAVDTGMFRAVLSTGEEVIIKR
jgi:hypothetical protein